MPCTYDLSPEEIACDRVAAEQRRIDEADNNRRILKELDTTTRLLCEVTKKLVGSEMSNVKYGKELTAWISKHRAADAKKLAKAKARRANNKQAKQIMKDETKKTLLKELKALKAKMKKAGIDE